MKGMFSGMMKAAAVFFASVFLAGAVHAASSIKDGRAIVTPAKDDRYSIDAFTFGKAELFGYISDLKDTKKITGIVLKNGRKPAEKATDEQKRSVASIGSTLELETFTQDGKELVPLKKE
jgi:hypothetical protein